MMEMGTEPACQHRGGLPRPIALVALAFAFLLVLVASTVAAEDGSKKIASLSLSGPLPEGVGQDGLLGDVAPRLQRLVERLEQAASDEQVGGVLLTIRSPDVGRARAAEVRMQSVWCGRQANLWSPT